jgi:methionyl-tRNA synthetase
MGKSFYITTAIDYVNGQPHLGHAYEKVVADVIARSRRAMGIETFFLTGLDEHGQKVQQAAAAEGKTPEQYCAELVTSWRGLSTKLGLTINDFIRTTEPRHKAYVQALLSKLHAQGDFYRKMYSGYYSTKEETFLTEKDRLPDGSFDPIYGQVVELEEENYYFKLSQHQAWLIGHIEQNPDFVSPPHRRNEVLGFLKNNALEDLCISRPMSRLNWGIPLPFDPAYVTYVWFDALTNYATVAAAHGDRAALTPLGLAPKADGEEAELWPADIHLVGKDIVKFHAVYWPIMLRAAGLPLPRQILTHGWWQKDGQKMSKTTGNIVDPIKVIDEWGLDAFRYYVIRELDLGSDGNWTDAGFEARYSAELANGLGNLVNRSLSMLNRYRLGVVPPASGDLASDVAKTARETRELLGQSRLQHALVSIWSLVTRGNQYVDSTAPFKLAKDPAQAARLDEVLYSLAEMCRILAVLLWPFLPGTATKIYEQLGLAGEPNKVSDVAWGGLKTGHKVGAPTPLFPRKDAKA